MKFIKYISSIILALYSVAGFAHNGCIYDAVTIHSVNYNKLADKNNDINYNLNINLNGTGLSYTGRVVIIKVGGGTYYNRYLDTVTITATSTSTAVVSGLIIPKEIFQEGFHYIGEDSTVFDLNIQLIDATNCAIGFVCHQSDELKVKLSYLTTNNILSASLNNDIKVYPNPSSELLFIEGLENAENISLYNLFGEKLKEYTNATNQIDISYLPQGIYTLVCSDKKKQKVVIKIEKK